MIVDVICRTPYVQEQVNIGSGPPGSTITWFRSVSNEPRFINTITFDTKDKGSPTLVMVHGYAASQGFFFRNFDALAQHFKLIAIDQLGFVCFLILCNLNQFVNTLDLFFYTFMYVFFDAVGVDQVGRTSPAKVQKVSSMPHGVLTSNAL